MKRLNSIIEDLQKKTTPHQSVKKEYMEKLKGMRKQIPIVINDSKTSRFYRRVITAHSCLQDPGMVGRILGQIGRNPDYRVVKSAYQYLKRLTKNRKSISRGVVDLLDNNPSALSEFQKAWLFTILRYTRESSSNAIQIAKSVIDDKNNHWYIKEQAAIFYGTRCLAAQQKKYALRKFEEEIFPASKRAWLHGLSQFPLAKLENIMDNMLLDTASEIHRMGRMVYILLYNKEVSIQHISNSKKNGLFDNFENLVQRSMLVDRIWEIEILSKNRHEAVKENLLSCIQKHLSVVKYPFLLHRLSRIEQRIIAGN